MFNKILESEIEWCEKNKSAMPPEFSKGFVAGLKQAVYLINAATQHMVWQDGEMVDDEDLLERAVEHSVQSDELSREPECLCSAIDTGFHDQWCPANPAHR